MNLATALLGFALCIGFVVGGIQVAAIGGAVVFGLIILANLIP